MATVFAVPDAIFADPRLAAVYDVFDGERSDLASYIRIADEFAAHQVIDVGCGTGSLAVLLAQAGRIVTGLDPADASLNVAQGKPSADLVTWIHGNATALPSSDADLAVMTGNVAQVFLDDAEWAATLRAIRGALREGGYLVFETRRPDCRVWEQWAASTVTVTRDIPGIGEVEQSFQVTDIALPLVSFRYTYTFASSGLVVTSDSTLRFRGRDEIEQSLITNGYSTLDVRDAADRPGWEFVFVTQRTL